jgi:hypothetical protein
MCEGEAARRGLTSSPRLWARVVVDRLRPISDEFIPAALAVSKLTREETLSFSRFRRPAETPFNLILEARP